MATDAISRNNRPLSRLMALAWPFPAVLGAGGQTDTVKILAAVFMLLDHLAVMGLSNHPMLFWSLGRCVYPLFAVAFAVHMGGTKDKALTTACTLTFAAVLTQPIFFFTFAVAAPDPLTMHWANGNVLFAFAGGAWFRYFQLDGKIVHALAAFVIFGAVCTGPSGGFASMTSMVGAIVATHSRTPMMAMGGALAFWSTLLLFQQNPLAGPLAAVIGAMVIVLAQSPPAKRHQERILGARFLLYFYAGHLTLLGILGAWPIWPLAVQ